MICFFRIKQLSSLYFYQYSFFFDFSSLLFFIVSYPKLDRSLPLAEVLLVTIFPSVIRLEIIISLEVNLLFVIHRVFTSIVLLLRSFFWLFPSLYLYMWFLEVQGFEFHVATFARRYVIFHDHFNRIEISEVFWTTYGLVPSMNELSFTSCKSLLKTLNRVQDNHLNFCMKCLVRCWELMFKWFIKYCW